MFTNYYCSQKREHANLVNKSKYCIIFSNEYQGLYPWVANGAPSGLTSMDPNGCKTQIGRGEPAKL